MRFRVTHMLLESPRHVSPPSSSQATTSSAPPVLSLPHGPCVTSLSAPEANRWFEQELHAHDSALKAYLHRTFPAARAEVDDVVQESYLRIWKARAGQPLQSAKSFLFKVARHITLDFLRRSAASPFSDVGDLDALPVIDDKRGVADAVSMDEKIGLLAAGLATLPPRGRDAVMLRKFKGLSRRETAAQLGISENTVDEHLRRSTKKLGEFLLKHGVDSYYDP